MLYEAVLEASRVVRGDDDSSYLSAVAGGPWSRSRLSAIGAADVTDLVGLINRWRTRYPSSAASRESLLAALVAVVVGSLDLFGARSSAQPPVPTAAEEEPT